MKLRIAMTFSADPARAGGSWEHVHNLACALARRGHHVSIFGPSNPSFTYADYHAVTRVTYIPLSSSYPVYVTSPIQKDAKISEYISNHYDLAHIHEPYIPFSAWSSLRTITIPKIVTFHAAWDSSSRFRFMNSLLPFLRGEFSRHINGAIFVSDVSKRSWQGICDVHMQQVVLGHGISSAYKPIRRLRRKKTVQLLFLARLVPRKGLSYLLKSLVNVIDRGFSVHLTVIGDGPARPKLESLVKKLRLDPHITFMGEILGERKIAFLQSADIFCAPYQDEANSLSLLEAIACGCPVVGFANESLRESFHDYPAPELFVPPKDISGLATAIMALAGSPKLHHILRLWEAKQRKKYSWDDVALQTEGFYFNAIYGKKTWNN